VYFDRSLNQLHLGSGQTSSQYGTILDANRHLVLAVFSVQVGTLVLLVVVKIHLYQNAIKHRDCWHCGSPFPFGPTCYSTVFPGLPAESDGAAVPAAAGRRKVFYPPAAGNASFPAGPRRVCRDFAGLDGFSVHPGIDAGPTVPCRRFKILHGKWLPEIFAARLTFGPLCTINY
jgi:hypothetical protein